MGEVGDYCFFRPHNSLFSLGKRNDTGLSYIFPSCFFGMNIALCVCFPILACIDVDMSLLLMFGDDVDEVGRLIIRLLSNFVTLLATTNISLCFFEHEMWSEKQRRVWVVMDCTAGLPRVLKSQLARPSLPFLLKGAQNPQSFMDFWIRKSK